MSINVGAVAAAGIISARGVIRNISKNTADVDTEVSPVFPPASTPLADSKYVVIQGIQKKLPSTVDIEST